MRKLLKYCMNLSLLLNKSSVLDSLWSCDEVESMVYWDAASVPAISLSGETFSVDCVVVLIRSSVLDSLCSCDDDASVGDWINSWLSRFVINFCFAFSFSLKSPSIVSRLFCRESICLSCIEILFWRF